MKYAMKYLFLSALIIGVAANLKDLRRYIRIRNM
ncbi:hypothetical protein LMG28138_04603 [Pararobbsia alpina]|uniref:Uncharacterized protein n=1 Tax=Pararobbsia alpina TaxID=621374 RepID=A0A6S7CW69_9BURK|nr:hypothetical protein LMG28138_04603 [Pararobbsia alpina]